MSIAYRNLNGYVKGLINGGYPDIGQVHYVVDSNFRTAAQLWTRTDGTGPLDLFNEREPGYVFYAPGTGQPGGTVYATDAAALQGAIDALVDFRGDVIYMTPGSYSMGAVVTFDVPNARWLGPPVMTPRRTAVTMTDTIGDHVMSAAADDMEIAFMTFVPLTAQNIFAPANGADRAFVHHVYYNALGVAASTATEFFNTAATTVDWNIEDSVFLVDAAQGDIFTIAAAVRYTWSRCKFQVRGGTWASCITFTGASRGNLVEDCSTEADGAASLITNVFTGATGANMLRVKRFTLNGTATPTASNIETGFDATTGIDISQCWQTGDATLEGGVEIALA